VVEHRDPRDDLRRPYEAGDTDPLTKLNALTLMAAEHQTHDYYMNVGPTFADPIARQLYAEIASIEEQHVTQYESIIDPEESWIEKWLLHEATEVYNYWSCLQQESNSRIKAIWQRMVDYELGQLHFVREVAKEVGGIDPAELLPTELPDQIKFESQRDFVRETLEAEVDLRASGTEFIDVSEEAADSPSVRYREQLNRDGSPSEIVAQGYCWTPGTELIRRVATLGAPTRRM
jgi:rubrerythrin